MFCCKELEDFSLNNETYFNFMPKFREWAIEYKEEYGGGQIQIRYCPWCGCKLPEGLSEKWFEELEKLNIDPWHDQIPEKFQTDEWYKELGL